MKMRGVLFVLFFAVGAAGAARAQLFSCTGEDGRVRYVSSADQCSSAYKELPSFVNKPAKKSSAAKPQSSVKSSPGKFAKVPPRRQSELDRKRGDILLYELRSEQRIEAALDGLVADSADDGRRQRLEERRDEHRRNIAAIQRELARLGYAVAE